jgi:hypothetical protein
MFPTLVLVDTGAGGKFVDSRQNTEPLLGYAGAQPRLLQAPRNN